MNEYSCAENLLIEYEGKRLITIYSKKEERLFVLKLVPKPQRILCDHSLEIFNKMQ
ncbi:hypothetical protein [Leptospira noguchii]|uniref:Uncharacterized protein n=2 Tax=Leptospira noguchii TaxID=28182 RepID=A0AAE9GE21_9LEPT|nr:hypothetical protein [Leptospira noguchii]EKR71422.1 hypothetical protein LEP1GSC041_4543 [Leptospira noguchii str. 2006001870]EMN02058.1 hypothetical protein LEP1GSC035_4886 [Leptospira noguchii str. 2007001578]EPE85902.1 hypothetical protein LEP1GSC021_3102 [Leptospira noguchii str. 1993005606]UOG29425.1 hypothetical protein MAL06_12075 [Leptospira noguchii]UOG33277.1 hypothetical protein MAL02_11435 [Leptospira noguchii]